MIQQIKPYSNNNISFSSKRTSYKPDEEIECDNEDFDYANDDSNNYGSDYEEAQRSKREILETKDEFRRMSKDKDSPSLLKKIARIGEVLGAGLLGGISMKYGLELSFKAVAKLRENKSVANLEKEAKSAYNSGKDLVVTMYNSAKRSKTGKNIEKKYKEFKQSDFGKTVLSDYEKLKSTESFKTAKKYYDKAKTEVKTKGKEAFISVASGASAISAGAESAGIIKKKNEYKKDID